VSNFGFHLFLYETNNTMFKMQLCIQMISEVTSFW